MINAQIILDSKNKYTGDRLTTFKLTYPRFIHSEMLTHRVFSRNSASSRAVPIKKMIERISENPVFPSEWRMNEKGMQGYKLANSSLTAKCDLEWEKALENALESAEILNDLGVHKQHVNRLLEPFMHVEVLLSGTEWNNFLKLRCDEAAQPEIGILACKIKTLLNYSIPKERAYHLPFIDNYLFDNYPISMLFKISTARCARVSYFLNNGKESDVESDIKLATRLKENGHWSPFEHPSKVAVNSYRYGNYIGWVQYRKMFNDESNGDYAQ